MTCAKPVEDNSQTRYNLHNFNVIGDELIFMRDNGLYIHNDSSQHTKRVYTPNKYEQDAFYEWRSPGAVVLGDTLYGIQVTFSQPPSWTNFGDPRFG